MSKQAGQSADGNGEFEHALVPLRDIWPAPENDEIYRSISVDDVRDLIADIRVHGMLEPLLVSSDGYLISGHRRRLAAHLAGLTKVPVKVHPVSREKSPKEFLRLLVEANTQRIKGADTLLAEAVIKVDPVAAHEQIKAARIAKEQCRREDCALSEVISFDDGQRCQLSAAKQPMIDAIARIIEEQIDHWPLTVRQIHYRLLGPDAPLKHASKPNSRYVNDAKSYAAVIDVTTRGRLAGLFDWDSIDDETRTVDVNDGFLDLSEFFPSGEPWPPPGNVIRRKTGALSAQRSKPAISLSLGAVIQRKTPSDRASCIGADCERFERELRRSTYSGRFVVVIEDP